MAHAVHQLREGRACLGREGISRMPEVVDVDLCGKASLRERLGPGLREVAPAELAAFHTDEDEPVRARCRIPVQVCPQLGDDQLRKRDLPDAGS